LEIKYGGVEEAIGAIGDDADGIREVFCDFQKYLYVDAT